MSPSRRFFHLCLATFCVFFSLGATAQVWVQQDELTAADATTLDGFGSSVSVDGNTAVIGSPHNANLGPGAAYVFTRTGAAWTLQAKLTANDGVAYDEFGLSVAVQGDTIVVGAPFKTISANSFAGAAYVFTRSGTNWSQAAELTASDESVNAQFGSSVSLDAGTIVIGAPVGGAGATGSAYVFTGSGNNWPQQAELIANDGHADDAFAQSLAVNAGTIAIGAPAGNSGTGVVYIFTGSGSNWSQQTELIAADGAAGDSLGFSVSMDGSTVVASAPHQSAYKGAAYVFTGSGSNWQEQAKLTAADGQIDDYFGYSISVSGDTAAVATPYKNSEAGIVYLFTRSGVNWSPGKELAAADAEGLDILGYSVSLSGNTVVGGAPGKNSGKSAAYAFAVQPPLDLNWVSVNALGSPSAREFAAASNDPSGAMMMFGGTDGTSVLADTWLWAGDEWEHFAVTNPPPARSRAGMALDTSQNQTVLLGGASDAAGTVALDDTWVWATGSWTSSGGTNPLPGRLSPAMAFDPVHGRTVLFAGTTNGSGALPDTWLFDGSNWSPQPVPNPPAARFGASMVYDGARRQILMFGGNNSSEYLNDLWTWNGTSWTLLNPAQQPPARAYASMTFDVQHGLVVMSGGLGASGRLSDTWVWNGIDWTPLYVVSPSSRYGSAMAYGVNHLPGTAGETVLFGGSDGTHALGDIWILSSPNVTSSILGTSFSNTPYDYTIPVTGGTPPYTFTEDGSPFTFESFGLSLNSSTGEITGTTNLVPGQLASFGVTITDSQGYTADIPFTLPTDSGPPLTLSPTTLPGATEGVEYLVQLSASGGTAPYTYSVTGLPGGMSLNASNQIAGLCTASSNDVVITVTDSLSPYPATAQETVSLTCNPPPQITTTSLPAATVNTLYTQPIGESGGTAPISFSLTGSVPAGFHIDPSSGILSGTPTSTTTLTFNITVTDFWGATVTQTLTLAVNASSALQIVPPSLDFGTIDLGTSESQKLKVTNIYGSPFKITKISFNYGPGAGKDFGYTTQCGGTINPGKSCTITVTMKAQDLGTGNATLVIAYNLPGSPATVALTGTVINPKAKLSKSSLNFGNVKVGHSSTLSVVLTSSGDTELDINSITVSGSSNFVNSTCSSTLAPKATCTISVTFTPTAKKSYSGTLKISDNASSSPQTVSLAGKGD